MFSDAGGRVDRAAAASSGDAGAAIDGAFHGLAGVSVDHGIATPPGGEMHGIARPPGGEMHGLDRRAPRAPRRHARTADWRPSPRRTSHCGRRCASLGGDPTKRHGFYWFDASTGAASVLGALLVAVVVLALRRVAHARARGSTAEDIDQLDETIYVFYVGRGTRPRLRGRRYVIYRRLTSPEFAHLHAAETRSEPSR